MCLLFTVGLGLWAYTVYQNRKHAHRIHSLMIVLGAFKVLTLLAQCGMYHYIRVYGAPDGWNIAYYVFTFFRSVLLFTVIILIGTGWSYMTPFLGDKERRVLLVVLPLQVRNVMMPNARPTQIEPELPVQRLLFRLLLHTCVP
jgi:G protein-coupled receptor 107